MTFQCGQRNKLKKEDLKMWGIQNCDSQHMKLAVMSLAVTVCQRGQTFGNIFDFVQQAMLHQDLKILKMSELFQQTLIEKPKLDGVLNIDLDIPFSLTFTLNQVSQFCKVGKLPHAFKMRCARRSIATQSKHTVCICGESAVGLSFSGLLSKDQQEGHIQMPFP